MPNVSSKPNVLLLESKWLRTNAQNNMQTKHTHTHANQHTITSNHGAGVLGSLLTWLGLAWLGLAWGSLGDGVGGCGRIVRRGEWHGLFCCSEWHVCMACCAAPEPNRAHPLNWHIIKLMFFCILAGHYIHEVGRLDSPCICWKA